MSKISHIISKNRRTFYRYDTGAPRSILGVYMTMITICGISSLFYGGASDNFLSGVIATQAILIGFAFTVIFQIGAGTERSLPLVDSIEGKVRQERLKKLTSEIFYNSCYFIVTAFGCVVLALLFLLHDEKQAGILKFVIKFARNYFKATYPSQSYIIDILTSKSIILIKFLLHAMLYFLIADSFYTFLRAVGRVIFLFERRVAD